MAGMRVLVVGGGGREHALAWRLQRSPSVAKVWCAPGNAGTERVAESVPIGAEEVGKLVDHAAAARYDLVVVGPEAPLAAGLADALVEKGLRTFGCSRAAAEIEGSKKFAKEVMARAGVPTARWGAFDEPGAAERFAEELCAGGAGAVVKADGLAAGKGVVVAADAGAARAAIRAMLSGDLVGRAGARVVVEERLVGREASCMALCDGERVWPLAPCEDHKTILDGDRGPMTGGMGAISPTPVIDAATAARVEREVLLPTARTLGEMGRPFRGLLYAGLMVTSDGPKVLEFNCRFGDPETQPLMARFEGDLAQALLAIAEGRAPEVAFAARAACCVVLAARGYPGTVEKGAEIRGLDEAERAADAVVFHAGTRRDGARVVVAGGRVLGVTGWGSLRAVASPVPGGPASGDDLAQARAAAYRAASQIRFDGMQLRRDIGARGGEA
jgi:phosphoribosylamine--glycine ligase